VNREIKIIICGTVCLWIFLFSMIVLAAQRAEPEGGHEAVITFSNHTNTTLDVQAYVMTGHDWDTISFEILDGSQQDVTVSWSGELSEILIIYSMDTDTDTCVRYRLKPNEWRTIILV
jgi:hypothetical protein